MTVFAQRLGVSAGTLRAMEHGAGTVQVGAWVNALWVRLPEGAIRLVGELATTAPDRSRRERFISTLGERVHGAVANRAAIQR